jgi:uncharacterized membrane protein (DUF2068 family)
MYQSYPTGGQRPAGPPQVPTPRPVITAVRLMYAGAALTVVWFVASLLSLSAVKAAVHKASPNLTAHQISNFGNALVAVSAFLAVVGVGLWILMAWGNRGGRNWARIVATVLFGLFTVYLLLSLIQPHSAFSLILVAVTWLVGLGAIGFLWQRESTAYFRAMSGRQG